jgi:glucuronate isomerase
MSKSNETLDDIEDRLFKAAEASGVTWEEIQAYKRFMDRFEELTGDDSDLEMDIHKVIGITESTMQLIFHKLILITRIEMEEEGVPLTSENDFVQGLLVGLALGKEWDG